MPADDSPLHLTPAGAVIGRRRLLVFGGATALLGACSRSGDSAGPAATTGGSTGASSTDAPATTAARTAPTTAVTTTGATATAALGALAATDFEALGTCRLMPDKTAGPFPLDEQFDRQDITEGYPGHPVRLGLRVVDAACAPVVGATVEIWHTDATGDYSAFADGGDGKDEGEGTTFLRGSQTSGDDGIVEFLTIYPGWYRGRAVHIHLRVHVGDETVLTSQLFFDNAYTESVYAGADYVDNGLPDTSNDDDNIAGGYENEGTLLHLAAGETSRGTGTRALLNLGVAR